MRRRLFSFLLLLIAVLLAVEVLRGPALKAFSLSDFGEYWAAGRLLLAGRNPYSPAALHTLQQSVGFSRHHAIMMWNPPWALSLVLPFALLPYRLASLCWLALNAALLLFAVKRLWDVYGAPGSGYLPLVLAVTFVPALINLRAGHLTPFMLLGIAGFLVFQRAQRPFLAGAAASLFLLKPHLLWLVLLLLGWEILRYRRAWLLSGLFTGTVVLLAIPMVLQPGILPEYVAAIRAFPMLASYAPNFGGLLRMAFGEQRHWLQFAPVLPGLLFFGYLLLRNGKGNWGDDFPLLAIISFITSPYGWSYDEVVLLPAFLQLAGRLQAQPARLRWTALGVYWAANAAVLAVTFWRPHDVYLLWTSPMWLLLYCLGLSATRPAPVSSAAATLA